MPQNEKSNEARCQRVMAIPALSEKPDNIEKFNNYKDKGVQQ